MYQKPIIELTPSQVVSKLIENLGARLTAFLGRVDNTKYVREWENGKPIDPQTLERFRVALEISQIIVERDGKNVARVWFAGINIELEGENPALLLLEGDISINGPRVRAAAMQFAYMA